MQAQHYAIVPDYFNDMQLPLGSSSPIHDPYLIAANTAPNFENGFSRGSSFPYPHQDYRYLLDRGELASRLCETSLVDHTLDATGLGFAGNPSSGACAFGAPEDIPVYQSPGWDWEGHSSSDIIAPAPVYAAPPDSAYFSGKSSSGQPSGVQSTLAQLPTPAAMAILLNPRGRSDGEPTQSGYEAPPVSVLVTSQESRPLVRPAQPAVATQATPEALSREKKHACTMCHKRFDRPSTLRKHLLVHTGEKAFVCETCGRRFGVASNLNRHVKRCIMKPVNTPSPSKSAATESPSSMVDSPEASFGSSALSPNGSPVTTSSSISSIKLGKRARPTPSPSTEGVSSSPVSTSSNHSTQITTTVGTSSAKSKPAGQKRRRRAPSPSQWVPTTLQNFNLLSDDSYRVTSVPLPPVRRSPPKEERDSWDENVAQAPYHPCGWSGILPGPGLGHGLGLGGKDVRNLDLGGRGGFVLGRVLVF